MQYDINLQSKADLFGIGNRACKGCGGTVAMRQIMAVLGERTIVVSPASCMATTGGTADSSVWNVPFYHTLFACAPAVVSGIRAALDFQGVKDVRVVSIAGDAGTADIGFQALSGAAERGERMIHICYDNEMYMNTGGQSGSLTPLMAKTSNEILGKLSAKKDMMKIMAEHGIPYLASASIAFPEDFFAKLQKALRCDGFAYLHVMAPCPAGWGVPASKTIEASRKAVECGLWELYEIENGNRVRTYSPRLIPVKDYVSMQARFSCLTDEHIGKLQAEANQYYCGEVTKWSS